MFGARNPVCGQFGVGPSTGHHMKGLAQWACGLDFWGEHYEGDSRITGGRIVGHRFHFATTVTFLIIKLPKPQALRYTQLIGWSWAEAGGGEHWGMSRRGSLLVSLASAHLSRCCPVPPMRNALSILSLLQKPPRVPGWPWFQKVPASGFLCLCLGSHRLRMVWPLSGPMSHVTSGPGLSCWPRSSLRTGPWPPFLLLHIQPTLWRIQAPWILEVTRLTLLTGVYVPACACACTYICVYKYIWFVSVYLKEHNSIMLSEQCESLPL